MAVLSQCRFLIAFIALCAATAIAMFATPNKASPTKSDGKKMSSSPSRDPEIERLTAQVKQRRDAADSWDTWNIRLLFIAGLAASLLVITAIGVSRSNRALNQLSDELDKAKDRKLQGDLKAKDDDIAKLNSEAAAARLDSDRFKLDIAKANERAADADKSAAEAKLELEKLRTPRSLTHIPELVTTLKVFEGTEYTFSGVCADEESFRLLKEIDAVLQQSKWKRVKPPGGFPAINVFGKEVDFPIPVSLRTGVHVLIDSPNPTVLESLTVSDMQQYARAAIALGLSLPPNISPPQMGGTAANMEVGTSTAVRIDVGKKP
jgi:hypothetical protein